MQILLKYTGTFFRIDHMIVQNTSLNKFKKNEIISSIFTIVVKMV